jgi:hypothetical protein
MYEVGVGSYIALATALLVVNVGDRLPIVWFLPTIVGSPLIAWLTGEVIRGRRPRLGARVPEMQRSFHAP